MIFQKIELQCTVYRPEDLPEETFPRVLVAGRSNCGKSMLLNRIAGRRGLARVSRTPGRTQGVRFFRVDDAFDLVDTPGYGFAKVNRESAALNSILLQRLLKKLHPAVALLLLDVRRECGEEEREIFAGLKKTSGRVYLLLTKCDKVSRHEIHTTIDRIAALLHFPPEDILPVSATGGAGIQAVLKIIKQGVTHERETPETPSVSSEKTPPQTGSSAP